MTENTTRTGQLEAALRTAIAASQVAYDLASRLADRVTPEEAVDLLYACTSRAKDRPWDKTSLLWMAQHGADDHNLPSQYLAQRILEDDGAETDLERMAEDMGADWGRKAKLIDDLRKLKHSPLLPSVKNGQRIMLLLQYIDCPAINDAYQEIGHAQ